MVGGTLCWGRAWCWRGGPLAGGRIMGQHCGSDRQVAVGWEPSCHPGRDSTGPCVQCRAEKELKAERSNNVSNFPV